jgi:hypothetical protein
LAGISLLHRDWNRMIIEYLVDGERREAPESLETWVNLLDLADAAAAASGRAVTAVRCNGVVQPSFRAAEAAARSVATMGRIEIDTADASVRLEQTIAMARQSLTVLASSAVRTAGRFHAGDGEAAGHDLGGLIEAIRSLTVLTGAIASVIDLRRGGHGAVQMADGTDVTVAVSRALRDLVECQTRQDWTRTAWCLERDLAPAVLRWQALFDRFDRLREAA